MLSGANNNRASGQIGAGVLRVNITGASGDDHVRTLAQQRVETAPAAQREADLSGGSGAMYNRLRIQRGEVFTPVT